MSNSINTLSPNFRDFLLGRNIISDTIKNNGLLPLLQTVAKPVEISRAPESILPSTDIEVNGEFYKDLNIIENKFQGTDEQYRSIDIIKTKGSTNEFSVRDNSNFYQQLNTTQNTYKAEDANYVDASIYLNSSSAPIMQMGPYLDEFGNLNVGGPSTQALDIIGSVLGGNGIGFSNTGIDTGFDVRSSLAGRVLSSAGVINDTKLGQLSVGFLATSLGNNVAFNIQQQSLGKINLNPLSLIKGDSVIRPNFNITVAKGTLGTAVDLLERILGFETPVSLLSRSSSIFASESGNISTIDRANSVIQNTGKGQILSLFANLNSNSNENLIGERIGYVPNYEDSRTERGFNQGPLNAGVSYAFNNTGALGKYSSVLIGGFNDDFDEFKNLFLDNKFTWIGTGSNSLTYSSSNFGVSDVPGVIPDFSVKKGLLFKTQELFKNKNMRTLTVGHGVSIDGSTQTQSAINAGFMSKGSGVLSESALNGTADALDPSSVFCRTWTTYDRYSQVGDLQKSSGLDAFARINGEEYSNSVLDDNGFVRIGPYKGEEIKKFMFSIENLAWVGQLDKLLESEKGEGDLLTGNKGRIMWFPPYDITFNETTSVNWDKNNFIGRGEPIYTYNNTERTGTLSWKIVVDHPNYMNFMEDLSSDEINSFFSGCLKSKGIRNRILTNDEQNNISVAENFSQPEIVNSETIPTTVFKVYFANDNTDIPDLYENGLKNGVSNEKIDYNETPSGIVSEEFNYGVGTTLGQGPVGSVGRVYNDNTNFGLNGQTTPIDVDGDVFEGWQDPKFITKINSFLKEKCRFCKINIVGYASTPGTVNNNLILSQRRASNINNWLLNTSGIISPDDEFREKRISVEFRGAGETEAGGPGCVFGSEDSEPCKRSRVASIEIEYDPTLKEIIEPTVTTVDSNSPTRTSLIPLSRFYNESHYFEKLEQTDNFIYDNIKQKIKHFHPGFHSITPEGFNSRLTFLQQCTRQGPTTGLLNEKGEGGNVTNPNNLAFGRPPVCILRIGDFYHTKIIIDNLTFDYDPLVWDLNPEGVGVQPMIVTVNMSFAFIGGSSLNSPINRLQNAVSFNYFANTEVYDPRAQKVKVKAELKEGEKASGMLIKGTFPNSENFMVDSVSAKGINVGNTEIVISQDAILTSTQNQIVSD